MAYHDNNDHEDLVPNIFTLEPGRKQAERHVCEEEVHVPEKEVKRERWTRRERETQRGHVPVVCTSHYLVVDTPLPL